MVSRTVAYPQRVPDSAADDGRHRNWARNATLGRPGSLATRGSESELRAYLAATSGAVRLLGSRMSPGRLLETPDDAGSLLDLSGMRGLLSIDADTATFAAATPLHDVYAELSARGRALPSSPGVIATQTLAGAMSTGTHGQGLAQSSIADSALAIRLVLADGTVADFDRTHPWFGATQLGLGSLGVLSRVTLRTRPSLVYTCRKLAVDADRLEREFTTWNRDATMLKAWWFPNERQVQVWAATPADDGDVARYRAGGDELIEGVVSSEAMNDTVEQTLRRLRDDTALVDETDKPLRTVTRFRNFANVTGDVYQVFCRGIPAPQINIEIGVPLASASRAMSKITSWIARTHPRLHYPIVLRCTGPSDAWLSPSFGQETCYFGFVVYYAKDGSLPVEGERFLRDVEKLLADEGGRPHWGKYFDETLYDWPALYPRWAEFVRARDALDPRRRFANRFTDNLFATGT